MGQGPNFKWTSLEITFLITLDYMFGFMFGPFLQ